MAFSAPTEKQSRIIWFALTGLAVATVIALVAAAVWGLGQVLHLLGPVLWPLAVAAVLACLISPVVDYFERRKISRPKSIWLVFAIVFVTITGVLASIIPQIVGETEQLISKVPDYSRQLHERINQFIAHPPAFLSRFFPVHPTGDSTGPDPTQNTMVNSATDWLTGSLPTMGSWLLKRLATVASGFGLLFGAALVPIYAYYFLLEQRRIQTHWREYLPLHHTGRKDDLLFILEAIGQYLVAFFRGQVLVALCAAVLYTIGFLVIGLNYAFLLGFAAIFLIMIPFLGAIILCVLALTLSCVQYTDWQHPALVLCVVGIVQTVESVFISPKIMGNRVGLHPLVIIVAVMAGTTLLGGILGGLLAIPLAAALRVILAHYVWKKDPVIK